MKMSVGLVLAGMILILVVSGCGDSSTSADETTATTSAERLQEELGDSGPGERVG